MFSSSTASPSTAPPSTCQQQHHQYHQRQDTTMDQNNDHNNNISDSAHNAAKRQRLELEQRSAFEEDMARIRASASVQGGAALTHAIVVPDASIGTTDTPVSGADANARSGAFSSRRNNESDDEENGNWLKTNTYRHTRVGNEFQVTELPSSSQMAHNINNSNDEEAVAHDVTVVPPQEGQNNRDTPPLHNNPNSVVDNDTEDDDEEGNWLKTFTPHHTRVGNNYQVSELPIPSALGGKE